ncbi:hypothetical protein ABFS83_14G217000 [Erythranthe nasuta]
MGPTACRRRTRKSSASARRRKTLIFKKQQLVNSKNQESSPVSSPANSKADDLIENSSVELMYCSSPCSTPKAERYRIPKIETCPPAPKKRRIVTNCSLNKTSIAFFASPDIDLFFNFALCGVPV